MAEDDVLKAAGALQNTDPAAALALLLDHRRSAAEFSTSVTAAIARTAYLAGDGDCALDAARAVVDARRVLPPPLRALVVSIMVSVGQTAEASRVVAAGGMGAATLATLSPRERILLQDSDSLEHDAAAQATLAHVSRTRATLADVDRGVSGTLCPKNACTVLKATMVMNGPCRDAYVASGLTIHDFCVERWPQGADPDAAPAGMFRFAVVRDPFRRLLSAYLNKFVVSGPQGGVMRTDKLYTTMAAQKLLCLPQDASRSISFETFVRYLAASSDAQANAHWCPQWRVLGRDPAAYDHLGSVEQLDRTFELLAERFGYVPEKDPARHNLGSKWNITRYGTARVPAPYRLLPSDLLQYRSSGFPPADTFAFPDLEGLLHRRWAEDYRWVRVCSAVACPR